MTSKTRKSAYFLESETGSTQYGIYVITVRIGRSHRHHGNALIPHESETKDDDLCWLRCYTF